jgi:hypothetical protein
MDSSSLTLIAIVAVAIVVIAALIIVARRRKSARLRSRFGPEYDHTVEDVGSRGRAEAELHAREKRVSQFTIQPLTLADRDRFVTEWTSIQAEFVDEPINALSRADALLTRVMRTRGYPVDNFEQRSADLSVDHPDVVQNYRQGHDIALRHQGGHATTEDLRQAMIHYRALFDELVSDVDSPARRVS